MTAVLTPPHPSTVAPPAPSVVTPPPVVQPPLQPFRWTIKQYRELRRVLGDLRTILIDGEIFLMVMPKPPHDTALGLTDDWLRTVFTSGYHVRNQMGFDVGEDTDPGPDLAVVTGSIRDYSTATPTSAVLIVEVAETTLFFDTTTKAEKYATAGVKDYWVIDLENRQLIVFRDPAPLPASLGANAYRTKFTLTPTDTVSPLAAPHATVTVSELLP